MTQASTSEYEFFAGAGDVASLMRDYDWAKTPLGDPSNWPQSLRTTVRILLTSRFAMWMAWGPELTCLYNDAYRIDTLGIKHPWALGSSARKVWAEIWPDIGPMIEQVLSTGVATWQNGMLLFLERSGYKEETYHTFSYQPLSDDAGTISGMLCVVTEETERVLAERRMELLSLMGGLLSATHSEATVLEAFKRAILSKPHDMPFTLTYLLSEDGKQVRLASATGIEAGSLLAPEIISLDEGEGPWPFGEVLARKSLVKVPTVDLSGERISANPWSDLTTQAVAVPIAQQGQEYPAGFLIAGVNPYRPLDSAYQGFYELVAGQLAAALANARGYEAERRRAEELAKLDKAKTSFFSNVSHELRTPLTLILGCLEEALARSGEAGEEEALRVAQRNALRLLKLVNTLLDFARLEAGRSTASFVCLDLSTFTEDLASNFRAVAERAGLRFVVDAPDLGEGVFVDREMWEKIVLNLVSNAIKHTLHGSIRVELHRCDDSAVLRVADTGSGIPEDEVPHIFDRFHRVEQVARRTHEGTGIGLALVKELVDLHGGEIRVTSELGKGSIFEVALPLGRAHLPSEKVFSAEDANPPRMMVDAFTGESLSWLSAEEAPPVEEEARRSDGDHVLVVDDNSDMRSYLGRLIGAKYEVSFASDGAEALNAVVRRRPDLVVTDVMMPGMDGFELIRAIRSDPGLADLPVIVLSARAGEEAKLEGLDQGADDYIVKPFVAQELMARVQSSLRLDKVRKEASRRERALEDEANDTRAKLDFVMRRLHDLVAIVGPDWKAMYVSESVSDLTGMPRSEILGQNVWDLFPALFDTEMAEDLRRTMETGKPMRSDHWLELFQKHFDIRAERIPGGELAVVAIDITGRVAAERELERRVDERTAELLAANRELEGFTYNVSHDLRAPLRSIVFNSSLLLEDLAGSLNEEQLDLLKRQAASALKVATLVDDLLKLSRLSRQELHFSQVDLTAVAHKVVSQLREVKPSKCEIVIQEGLECRGDETLLSLLLFNLIENGCKFSPNGGLLQVGFDREAKAFYVRDQGIGFEPEYGSKIFEPFERLVKESEFPGTGIGLANVKRIVERHSGKIWADSGPGQGATFYFQLSPSGQ
ncbi:MAG TPA: ATP-binding protein [Fimbriimonas sp.]|nr:ATP-binding protein [Fimbriimonas sp.]